MNIPHIPISRGMLCLIVVCFLTPFITVSCNNLPVTSNISGVTFITGGYPRIDTPEGSQISRDRVPVNTQLIFAFIGVLAALAASFIKLNSKPQSIVIAIASGISFFCFFIFKSALDSQIRVERNLIVTYQPGFWLAWTLLFFVVALNSWVLYQQMPKNSTIPSTVAPNVGAGGQRAIYCSHCGNPASSSNAKFCMSCGKGFN